MSITSDAKKTASEAITAEVTSWPGVEAGIGRRGEFGFEVNGHQIGHLHGDRTAHFGFPRDVGAELREQGRVGPHPVNPHSTKMAARPIESEEDVGEVIELMRPNYERVTAGPPSGGPALESPLPGLHATEPTALSFAPSLHVRAFLLRRERGNLLIYASAGVSAQAAAIERLGGISRRYLNHGHEAMFLAPSPAVPLYVHRADAPEVKRRAVVRAGFSRRHRLDEDFEVIPTPGHTPGATAFLWDSGDHRMLFSGDTIALSGGDWTAALLESSDRAAYIESLELIRELDFDVLVPWAASAGERYLALTDEVDRRDRIDAIVDRLRNEEA